MWGYIIFLTCGVYYPPVPCHILMTADIADPGVEAEEKPSLLVAKQLGKRYQPAPGPSRVWHTKFTLYIFSVMVLVVSFSLTESIITWEVGFWACLLWGIILIMMSICAGRPILIVCGAIS